MGEQLLAAAAARRDEPVKIWSLNGKQYPSVDAAFAAALGFQRSANCKPYWQLVEFEMSEAQGKRQMLMKCSICGTYYKYSNMAQWAKMHFTEDFSGCKGNKRAAAAPADPPAASAAPGASSSKRSKPSSSSSSNKEEGPIQKKFTSPAQVRGGNTSNQN
jgi:hypothetical protein